MRTREEFEKTLPRTLYPDVMELAFRGRIVELENEIMRMRDQMVQYKLLADAFMRLAGANPPNGGDEWPTPCTVKLPADGALQN